jgi:hypothetical protein
MEQLMPWLAVRNACGVRSAASGVTDEGTRSVPEDFDAGPPGAPGHAARPWIRCAAACLLVCVGFASAGPVGAVERTAVGPATRNASAKRLEAVQAELATAQKQHAARLVPVAQGFSDLGLADEAKHCRALAAPMETVLFRVNKLPKEVQPEISLSLPERERELRESLRQIEEHYAADLYSFCRKALRAGYPSYAYQIVEEVVRHNPDHPAARKILGYKLRGKEWVTPFAADRLEKGYVWDDAFGWLPKEQLAKYKAGKRWCGGRWMSIAQEAEIRRDFQHAWQVRTDHYLVRTDKSLERGVEIAKTLEQYHDFFMQTFAGFFSTPDQMMKLFQTSGSSSSLQSRSRPYLVDYFRSRDEYVNRLVKRVPQIGITNGLYYTADRVAYFYYDPQQQNQDTLFHEATHQLFYENDKRDRMIAMDANFWIVEGISCYMESYHVENGQSVVGDPKHVRIEAARHRCLIDKYYIPLDRFTEMGMYAFQSSRQISMNYSQAAGLAHFFMHYDGGRYRDALIEHLSEIYRAGPRQRTAVRSLADLTGVSFPELDRQYEEYMQSLSAGIPQSDVRRTAAAR